MAAVHPNLRVSHDDLAAFCRKWKISRLELFGSALRADFDDESDVDILVTFDEGRHPSSGERLDMEEELRAILGREVDLIKRDLVESSENWIRRKRILESARPIYAAS
jgi:predicted nucleotidyltransferase